MLKTGYFSFLRIVAMQLIDYAVFVGESYPQTRVR